MKTHSARIPLHIRLLAAGTSLALIAGCATQPSAVDPADVAAARALHEARSLNFSTEARVGHYLDAAALTAPRLGSGKDATPAREIYNAASAELTIALRSEDNGRMWNHPLDITSGRGTYHLRLQPAGPDVWSPAYFTSFYDPKTVKRTLIKKDDRNIYEGVGGALVGVRSTFPREKFAPFKGTSAAVTTTLDFKGNDATIALRRPAKETTVRVEGEVRPLAADFSAPISYYRPPSNLLLVGFLGGLRSARMMDKTGLYFLQPYDPDRIPLVFVHGLFSTPFTWVETMNGLQADPEIRKRYQFWVFGYGTGNPILYSALRLREELAKVDKLYPNHRPYVLVGHSMGGLLSHMQVVNVTRAMWEKELGDTARSVFNRNSKDSLIVRAMTFQANPRIGRVIFVCAPHRGSELASSGAGKLGISLITLPVTLTRTLKDSITTAEIAVMTGTAKRLPNSVSGLKPTNPTFKVVNSVPMTVSYHSIIGDRGKGNSPNSTDGVVPYWSSHFDGAKSECIVPGPHSSCTIPETIKELDRILKAHLKKT